MSLMVLTNRRTRGEQIPHSDQAKLSDKFVDSDFVIGDHIKHAGQIARNGMMKAIMRLQGSRLN
jgi:tRNA G37 N-methylase TrmD